MLLNQEFDFKGSRGFLALEGVNGAGKSTLQKSLARYLEAKGRTVIVTHEPGATPLGGSIRKLVLDSEAGAIHPLSEILLFAADRAEHVQKIIRPALLERKIVISDRYYYSTVAFQGYGRGVDLNIVEQVNSAALSGTIPDFVILLDMDPKIGLERAKKRDSGTSRDAFEKEDLKFHSRLRDGFIKIAKESPEPFLIVDASKSFDAVMDEVKGTVDKWSAAL